MATWSVAEELVWRGPDETAVYARDPLHPVVWCRYRDEDGEVLLWAKVSSVRGPWVPWVPWVPWCRHPIAEWRIVTAAA